MTKKPAGFKLWPRFRVECGEGIALGPGKVDLLEMIRETGSIAEAAKQLQMSYMRAWTLVKTMEDCFREPLIKVTRGGANRGGAQLTQTGEEVIVLYRRLEEQSSAATADTWRELQTLLRQV